MTENSANNADDELPREQMSVLNHIIKFPIVYNEGQKELRSIEHGNQRADVQSEPAEKHEVKQTKANTANI